MRPRFAENGVIALFTIVVVAEKQTHQKGQK